MKKITLQLLTVFFIGASVFAQEKITKQGHTNQNKFKQLKDELATPNSQ
jgi:hypothetical protein